MSDILPIEVLKEYKKDFSAFFATETSEGDTIQTAIECGFDEIYSVEIDKTFFERAQQRFIQSSKVSLINGKSVDVLRLMVPLLTVPTVFFLNTNPFTDYCMVSQLSAILKIKQKFAIIADNMNAISSYGIVPFNSLTDYFEDNGLITSLSWNDRGPTDLFVAVMR